MHSRLLATVLLAAAALPAQLELPALFSDHMVLQSGQPVPVWGWATPGQEVVVEVAGQSKKAVAGKDGKWQLKLDKLTPGGPHEMSVVAGERALQITDVVIGEVWLGSGQSNMAWTVRQARDFEKEKAAADLPHVRMFTVKRVSRRKPQDRCEGSWKVCTPENVGRFSATAFFFGRHVHAALKVPVGLINTSWGGTAIEAWTSEDVQSNVEQLSSVFEQWTKRKKGWDPANAQEKFDTALAEWKKQAKAARDAGKRPRRRPRRPTDPALNQNHPANLYNGMIAPLIPYAMRGAIWYQGERNARNQKTARLYRRQLPLMINDWRKRWGQGDFPFAWVQLPNFKKRQDNAGAQSAWAVMRDSMFKSLRVPNTGMAVTIDVGEAKNIHPKDKQSVGKRLSLWALGNVYGKQVAATSGPLFQRAKRDGNKLIVRFRHADGLKTSDGGPVRGFAIRGPERGSWQWADAVIEDGKVVVSHKDIAEPKAVRYAWADNPDCNLVNGAGLPAGPFRASPR